MQIKTGVNFHNRFDIIKSGKWVGYGENIILDQMWGRLCNFSSYFVNIHFGTGSGTPTPERNTLFGHLGTRSAGTEEIIKAFPVSSWKRKIVLNPEEYVGQTITEVGIAYGSTTSNLVTHAMLKDAEGNPLTVEKTDLDVIEIYATIFITLTDNPKLKWVHPNRNVLLSYLLGDSLSTLYATADCDLMVDNLPAFSSYYAGTRLSLNPNIDTINRKRILTGRYGIDYANYEIKTLGLENIFSYSAKNHNDFNQIFETMIGLGDGETTIFTIPYGEYINLDVKVNDVIETQVEIVNRIYPSTLRSFLSLLENEEDGLLLSKIAGINGYGTISTGSVNVYFKTKIPLSGLTFTGGTTSQYTRYHRLCSSPDGVTWTSKIEVSTNATITIPESWGDNLYYRIEQYSGFTAGAPSRPVGVIVPIEMTETKIIFTEPPALDAVISISGAMNALPKTSDYVLDVTFEIQFGEGV